MRQGFCLAIAVPSWILGKAFPIIGGAVFAILAGMALTLIIKKKGAQKRFYSSRLFCSDSE